MGKGIDFRPFLLFMKRFLPSVSLLGIAFVAVLFTEGTVHAASRSSVSFSSKPSIQKIVKSSNSSKKAAKSSAKAAKQSTESCVVLGNIGDKKEKIFHVPGCPNYTQVKIETSKGERVFCSEADAVAAGWHKAKNCPH
jgi:hypothetical protein